MTHDLALPGSDDALVSGPRLFLRPVTPDDYPAFEAAAAASRELLGEWINMPSTPEQFERYLLESSKDINRSFLLCRHADRAFLGAINLTQIVRGLFQSAYLAYYAVTPHAKQGYLTEGLRLVLRYTFETLGLHRLEANIQPNNVASLALVRRCGFEREGYSRNYLQINGVWRDHERWAIREETWRQSEGPP